MIKHYSEISGIEDIKRLLLPMEKNEQVQSVLLFIADSPEIDSTGLNSLLKEFKKPVVGGIFPEIIYNNQKKQTGFYVVGTKNKMQSCLLDLENLNDSLETKLENFARGVDESAQMIWVLMDAFAENKDYAINAIYDEFGPYKNYIGGGAGTLQLKSTPCIISNECINKHCVVIATMNCDS